MKKKTIASVVVILLVIIGGAFYFTNSQKTLNGYIIDKHCAEMDSDPSEETKMCLTMESCAASGYGVSVKQNDDKYKFYLLDDKGQDLVKDIISKTKKEKGISIEVKGKIKGDSIQVAQVTEK